MPDKTYRVANPRGFKKGVRILATAEKEFYEGDEIAQSDLKDAKDLADLLAQGLVVEVKSGS